MPVVQCPVEGFEQVEVSFPDEWLMVHLDKFARGREMAPAGASDVMLETFGAIALCDRITGLELKPKSLLEMPLYYAGLFGWLRRTVLGPYYDAQAVPKNS